MCDHTAKLPPELRRMICNLVPRESLKHVRLVDQAWSHVAATLLWHTFTTDLRSTATRDFNALLTSRPGGFLDSVRILNIRAAGSSSPQTGMRLLLLLSLLPRDSLQEFTGDHAIESETLGVLIKRQPRLRVLSSPIKDDTGAHGPPGKLYVAGNLSRLKTLTIFANESQKEYGVWFPYTTSLDSLTVSGMLDNYASKFEPWRAEPKLVKLRSLYLDSLCFSPSTGALDAWMDLNCLEGLTIRNCTKAETFLESLAESYAAHGLSALKSFKIYNGDSEQDWTDQLEMFLAAVRGLEYLYVSVANDERLDILSICHQACSLRYLVVEYLDSWDQEEEDTDCMYDATELESLSKACSHIEELGLSCAQINFGEWPSLEPFVWSPAAMRSSKEKEVVKFLDVIATFRNLRVLRMTQSALDIMGPFDDGAPFLERQWRYQQYAEQILQYLAERDSSVELLVFSPTRVFHNLCVPEGNEHIWPHYYYLWGESEIALPRGQSKKRTIAVPVKPSEISKYMVEPAILVDPKKVK